MIGHAGLISTKAVFFLFGPLASESCFGIVFVAGDCCCRVIFVNFSTVSMPIFSVAFFFLGN